MENLNRFFIFLSLFFAIIVLVSSCANQPAAKEAGTPAVTKEAQPAATGNEAVPSGDAKGVITGLISGKSPTYQVSYDVKGEEELAKMTMYFKNKNMRYDMVSHGNQVSLFAIDGKMYQCSSMPKMCVFFGNQSEQPQTGTEQVEGNIDSYKIAVMPSRQIAGTTAKCFSMANSQGTAELCYSKEGVPLYIKSTSDNSTFERTATEYSTSVSDSVFTLPAEPQDNQDIKAQMAKYQQQ